MPVKRKDHHNQFRATPPERTMSVTRFGVPREKVVATIEIPNSHHGIFLPERKKLAESFPPFLLLINPMIVKTIRKIRIIVQSILFNAIIPFFCISGQFNAP